METEKISPQKFTQLLLEGTNLSVTDLAKELGIARATIHRWMRGEVYKFHPTTKNKVNNLIDRYQLNFKLGYIYNSHIEIIQAKESEVKYGAEQRHEEQQVLINKLVKENFELKEKIALLEQQLKINIGASVK